MTIMLIGAYIINSAFFFGVGFIIGELKSKDKSNENNS